MKTVKFYRPHGGHVARLPDTDAAEAVRSGEAMYCPKHWYRAAILTRPNITFKVTNTKSGEAN